MDVPQPVVARVSPALFELGFARWQIQFVVDNQHLFRGNFEETRHRGHGLARAVHVGLRLHQPDALPTHVGPGHQTEVTTFHLQ